MSKPLNAILAALGCPPASDVATPAAVAAAIEEANSGRMGVIVHAAAADTARPVGFDVVTWIGSVEPVNAEENDIWEEITA